MSWAAAEKISLPLSRKFACKTFFRQEKKREEKQGQGKEEMSKWVSVFFIVFPRNTLSSAGISVQRFLYRKK